MRARRPDRQGFVDRDGVRIGFEVFGAGATTVLFVPTDPITHSGAWRLQVPFLARNHRVVTVDPRGNGRSDRPLASAAYGDLEFVGDTVAVLDELAVERAVLVGICASAWQALVCAALHPDRVLGVVAIGPWAMDRTPKTQAMARADRHFDDVLDGNGEVTGWAMRNRHYWLRDWPGYARFFFEQLCVERHSIKLVEDMAGYAAESTGEVQVAAAGAESYPATAEQGERLLAGIGCPVLVIHGTEDRCQPYQRGVRVAELTGGRLLTMEGSGHLPQGRDPVAVNNAIGEFVTALGPRPAPRRWRRPMERRRRVLYLSSPIGLGHARRDLAIVQELLALHPGLAVDWLTQDPVLGFLASRGEHVHPASAALASETSHVEGHAGEHDLHAFRAIRDMDEVMVANFHVFDEVVASRHYDLCVGDEAWEVDHFLHENPELKRSPFAWLTDFVGWLPMPDGGAGEAVLTADCNAEMIEHLARFPRVRDRSVFVGDPDDLVADPLGPGLPGIREWTEQHFEFCGYISGFGSELGDRGELRQRLGYRPDQQVCVVSVGGSAVGEHLLRRVVAAYPMAKRRLPALRMVVATGPRIDPSSFRPREGLEIHGDVADLHLHHAACDLGVVQGGLTTTMELTSAGRPFLYFPLRHHFEQNRHVVHRLDRHRAGRRMDYSSADPDAIADAIVAEIDRPVSYLAVPTDGAARAARYLAELI